MFTFIEFIEVVGLLNDDFECCCEGPCSDLFPGIMKDEENENAAKGLPGALLTYQVWEISKSINQIYLYI